MIVGFCMAGDLDSDGHLRGIAPDRVIGGERWLAYYLFRQAFIGVYLPLQVTLGRWRKCSQEWPCCLVDICLCHHRVVIGVLPVMKGSRVLDRDASHAAEAVEIERSDIALWPNDCGMGRNCHLSLNRGVSGRDHRRGSGDNLDAISPGK